MRLKNQTVKELESLNPSEIMRIYEMIISLKTMPQQYSIKKVSSVYLTVRNALKQYKGSMSEDIILSRGDRV